MDRTDSTVKSDNELVSLEEFFDNAAIGLHIVGEDGTILRANQFELDLLGYSPEEYIGRKITDFHADDEVIGDILHRLKSSETLNDYPARLKCKNGSVKHVLITSNVYWRDGKFVHTRCFTRDVTPTSEQDRLLDQIFALSPAFMTVLSVPDFCYLKSNEKHNELLQKNEKEIVGKKVAEVLPEMQAQGIIELLTGVAKSGEAHVANEMRIQFGPPGKPRTCYLNFVYQPLKDQYGKVFAIAVQGFDVTEAVHSRVAIENERENFRNLFKQTPEMVCILKGPDHVFEFVNEAHIKALGFDATGKAVREAQPESVEVHGLLDNVYRTGVTAELHEIPITVGDHLRYFNLTFAARRDYEGETNGVMILGIEVTGEVRARESTKQQSKWLESVLNQVQAGIILVDPETGDVRFANKAAERIGSGFERNVNKMPADWYLADIAGKKLPLGEYPRNRAARGEKVQGAEYRWQTPGKTWDFLIYADLLPEMHGHPAAALVSFLDISDAKKTQEDLQVQLRLTKTITDNAASSLFMMDKNGHPTFMNPAAEKLTGYKLDEIKDKPLHYAVHYKKPDGSHYPMEECPIDNAQTKLEAVQNQEEIFVDKGGRLFPVSYSVSPLERDGKAVGSVLEFKDISEQKRIETEIRQSKDEAERANQLKSAFLANMSHEIRTPLGAMIGFADLLRDPGLTTTERSNYIDILSRNGHGLSVIINDILDLSKVEAGHLTLEFTEADPEQIASDVVSLLRVKAKEKDLSLILKVEKSLPERIVSDPDRMKQILMNLVGNAVKFTQFGSVELRAFGCETESGRPAVCFEISDTGIGIPPGQKDRIFEMFVQGDGSMARRFGGTGLGLALSRRLARALGGEVEITHTVEGKGTTFLIRIEDQPERKNTDSTLTREETVRAEPSLDALIGVKVLVVDDSPDNQQLIWHYLSKRGAVVETADNGVMGYRKALVGDYDIILMDIQMPEMDGYTATHKLRAAGYRKPILALTAHVLSDVREKCLNVGCSGHLAKPINPKLLIATIADLTARSTIAQ